MLHSNQELMYKHHPAKTNRTTLRPTHPGPLRLSHSHEIQFLNHNNENSAISAPESAISSGASKANVSFGTVPKVPFQNKTFSSCGPCLYHVPFYQLEE